MQESCHYLAAIQNKFRKSDQDYYNNYMTLLNMLCQIQLNIVLLEKQSDFKIFMMFIRLKRLYNSTVYL